MGKKRWHNPRTPMSITHIGRFTVRIYDLEAYAQNIEQYYSDEERSIISKVRKHTYHPYPKKKASARYSWATPLDHYKKEGA